MKQTLFEKLWQSHIVHEEPNTPAILYIDGHIIHEVTSPQAFNGLRDRHLPVRRPDKCLVTADHNVPTKTQKTIHDVLSKHQIETLEKNCTEFGLELYGLGHKYQGIVHVIGPELGFVQPGMTIVCGDSHTSTNGALGTLAWGVGTSEVEMVLATQCILQNKPKTMEISINGALSKGVTPKDVILTIINKIGVNGATGYAVEFTGTTIADMDIEGRMTICNMTIEAGGRMGMVAVDAKTIEYLKGRKFAPKGDAWDAAVKRWKTYKTDHDASYDRTIAIDARHIEPRITYGTNPGAGIKITETIPHPSDFDNESDRRELVQALEYMDLKPGQSLAEFPINKVFIGSCTNSRLVDLKQAAEIVQGKQVAGHVQAVVVPGSESVKREAERTGLDRIFKDAGFEWRHAGCSSCLGMNEDKIGRGEYCVSTSNRNFEGRQGPGARTFLASPLTAAASAIRGTITDPRTMM